MGKKNAFELDFEEYIREGEPSQKEKTEAWAIAIGLQQVDGLKPSKYLYETAKKNIEGEISIEEVKYLIDSYYETNSPTDRGEEEADKVSARITELLEEKSFSFTPNQIRSIHERLFKGIFHQVKAGEFRKYNITKKEWVLDGDTVLYANADLISETLKYDFTEEKKFDYSSLTKEEVVKRISTFIANIWQIHPFGEGNTRTMAVFTIKYLRSLGFKLENEPFEKNSWYFRNALVRANYTNLQKGIYTNSEYLEKFFRNLLLEENHELKNRFTHIRYNEKFFTKNLPINQENLPINQENLPINQENLPINKVQVELLNLLKENPTYTYADLAEKINRTRETIRTNLRKLENLNLIRRVGANKNGHWQIVEPKEN